MTDDPGEREPVDGLREAHEDEPTARRLMELATDPEWSEKADLAAWTRVVRGIRGPIRVAASPDPVSEPVDGLREAVNAYIAWQYRMKGARRFTLTDLRAVLAAAPAEDRGVDELRNAATGFLIAVDDALLDQFIHTEDGAEVPEWVERLDDAADTFRAVLQPPKAQSGDPR